MWDTYLLPSIRRKYLSRQEVKQNLDLIMPWCLPALEGGSILRLLDAATVKFILCENILNIRSNICYHSYHIEDLNTEHFTIAIQRSKPHSWGTPLSCKDYFQPASAHLPVYLQVILKSLISWFSCVWLGLELNWYRILLLSAFMGKERILQNYWLHYCQDCLWKCAFYCWNRPILFKYNPNLNLHFISTGISLYVRPYQWQNI